MGSPDFQEAQGGAPVPGAPPRPAPRWALQGRGQTRLRAGGVSRTVRSRPWAALRDRGRKLPVEAAGHPSLEPGEKHVQLVM